MSSLLKSVSVEMIEIILENAFEWLVVVDEGGTIIYMNDSYCRFLEVERERAVGSHVTEIIENTRMHIVAATGKEEVADLQYIRGNYMIANRIPIVVDGQVIGAFGSVIFRDTSEWMQMSSHVKNMMSKIQSYIHDINSGVRYTLNDIIGDSEVMLELKEKVQMIAPSDISILIRGESGTGKELFAHSIHQLSERSSQPFIKVNCAAIPEHLLESELFGYEEGAFTGAKKGGKKGKFQLAHKGTLFLDEIGDMPLNMQAKLLRALQEGEVEAVGSTKIQHVDVRIIAATNRPLETLMEEKRFRSDLYYRINVIPFHIPSLKERKGDLSRLASFFLEKSIKSSGKRISGFEGDVLEIFKSHSWPGNLRELENVIHAATYLTSGTEIKVNALPSYLKVGNVYKPGSKSLKEMMEETERAILEETIRTHPDKRKAARVLGLGKSSLYEKLNKYHLQ
ncbi:AAA family ATPase [Rossellomorea marisflavi]|uniref:HTH-type transcriptional regulatory protein TyrR n=1 Tax=Rossellomorea marisflavi TaxID=189381 RepID=A0A5D4RBD4_9BACI|nr:sigma 54-interacting transcriptional regulator [Rossellomorea marisflavi]MDW4527740.1 sigma 54-interacting transcriptional regulator [Rossellomorea marisflavi]TYS48783.1 AAA family ATPase [Rossellomorea marisflavi]WJV19992.1 sigma 54-interacting transcriptional regulator [Rossellomorea marisflavi]